jgi:predicted nucleotide-binding protein
MPRIDTALSQIQSTLNDLHAADHNTYDRHVKRLSRALHAPEIDAITRKLTEGVDFENWLAVAQAAGGAMLGGGIPSWPAEPEKELGMVALLVDHFAAQPGAALQFAMTHYHGGSRRPTDDLQKMTRDILVPFVNDYITYVNTKSAVSAKLSDVDSKLKGHEMGMGSPAEQRLSALFFDPLINWDDDDKLREWLRQQDPDQLEQFLNWFDFSSRRDRETLGRQELRRLRNSPPPQPVAAAQSPSNGKVFIAHGHDEAALHSVARFIERLDIEAIILREQPDSGRAVIEKFEDCVNQVNFAVVLLTPDDLGGVAAATIHAARARQNVVFELGYFTGKLGRGRVCLLRKGEVEIPSDLYGVIYTEMDLADGWKRKLARELKEAGLAFDPAKVL